MKKIIALCTLAIGAVWAEQSAPIAMKSDSKIYVAGHNGLVGSAIVGQLHNQGFTNIVTRTKAELNLCRQDAVENFFATEKPEFVFLAAAHVGGIVANSTYPADFGMDNLMIETNVLSCAHKYGVKKLLFLGSSCIYPRDCPQPMKEEYLLTGPLEKTNEQYALAKISGIILCRAFNKQYGTHFISCMPTNLYGENDNFHPQNSHVIPALISKMYKAYENNEPSVTFWGTGSPMREFLSADDCASACVFLMQNYNGNDFLNVGTGQDVTIKEVISMISEIIGYRGQILFDSSKPDGTPRKLLDVSKINALGWRATIDLRTGLEKAIAWYIANKEHVTKR